MRLIFFIVFLLFLLEQRSQAQIISNGNFTSGTASWGCAAETNPESVYGGSGSNSVAEVDAGAGLCQTMTGLTIGNYYLVSFVASRRTGGCPSPTTTNVNLTVSGGVLSTTVTRTNTTFGFTSSSYLFMASSTTHTLNFAPGAGFGSSTCGMIIDNVSVSFSPLPIELLNFDAISGNSSILFNWSTASEKNNAFFEIEGSKNGIDFESFVQVPSKAKQGNSNTRLNYVYEYTPQYTGINYYRLKQVDHDRAYSYSKIISVISSGKDLSFNVYPNPNAGNFTINTGITGLVQVQLINYSGKVIHSQSTVLTKENDSIRIELEAKIQPGIYQCVISSEKQHSAFHLVIE